MKELKGNNIWVAPMQRTMEWMERNELMKGQTKWVRIWYFHGGITQKELQRICMISKDMKIESIRIEYDAVGYPKGSAVVRLSKPSLATKVFGLNDMEIPERGITLKTAYWTPDPSPQQYEEEMVEAAVEPEIEPKRLSKKAMEKKQKRKTMQKLREKLDDYHPLFAGHRATQIRKSKLRTYMQNIGKVANKIARKNKPKWKKKPKKLVHRLKPLGFGPKYNSRGVKSS